jgi:UDP-glucose 4-epimerase
MSRVLVTGGLGVVGAWVTRGLLQDGHAVVTLDPREDLSLLGDVAGEFDRRLGSVTDLDATTELLRRERIDAIAHCVVFDAPGADPYAAFSVNAQGTVVLLEAARVAGVKRLVYTSSKAVLSPFTGEYGHPTYRPVPPDLPRRVLPALAVYTTSKRFSEDVGEIYADRFGIEFTALRFATIVGPGKQARHGPTSVHSRMIENAMVGQGTDVPRGRDQRDDMVYVKDVAQSVIRACTALGPLRRAYNIGSGQLFTLPQFADAIRRYVADVPIAIGPGLDYVALLDTSCLMDIDAARADLGYEPCFDVDSMVLDYVRTQTQLGLAANANQKQSAWR